MFYDDNNDDNKPLPSKLCLWSKGFPAAFREYIPLYICHSLFSYKGYVPYLQAT